MEKEGQQMLRLLDLDEEQIVRLYRGPLHADFPEEERRPLERILRFHREGTYRCHALCDGDDWVGYAFFARLPGGRCALLDYYAMRPGLRGKGYGSRFFPLLAAAYPGGILAEVESAATAPSEAERIHRQRRTDFYRRCGMEDAGFGCRLFGVVYDILWLPGADGLRGDLQGQFDALYRHMLPGALYQQNLCYLPG